MNATKKMFGTLLVAALALVIGAACGEPDTEPTNDANCGQGDALQIEGRTYCIYKQSITEEGFSCPAHVSAGSSYGGLIICGATGEHPDGLFERLHELYDAEVLPTGDCVGMTCSMGAGCEAGVCAISQDGCWMDTDCPSTHHCVNSTCQPKEVEQGCLEACAIGCVAPQYQPCATDGNFYCSTCQIECGGLEVAEDPAVCDGPYWEVDHFRHPCVAEETLMCLMVRRQGAEGWELFYDTIEGFEHVWGRTYLLKLDVEAIVDPPVGGSALKYTLVETVEQGTVVAGTTFDLPFWVADTNLVIATDGEKGTLGADRAFQCDPANVCEEIDAFLTASEAFRVHFRYDTQIDDPLIAFKVEVFEP
ncbi:MAG: DUF4377 domain-containing protein [Bradymonadaceae bacterium]|nr:DUF4377 domain-containing protein [Lujinxingiaceae bacterium]